MLLWQNSEALAAEPLVFPAPTVQYVGNDMATYKHNLTPQ